MFGDKPTRKRIGLARRLERAAMPERPHIGRGPRYLVPPAITAACAPSLLAIAGALRSDPAVVSDDGLRAVKSFVSGGSSSPFLGSDVTAAMREAVRLRHAVIGSKAGGGNSVQVTAESNIAAASPALTGG
jgi:hypothetical protein